MESALLEQAEAFDYYTRDTLSDFINMLKAYPKATDASNRELLRRYREGDMLARDMLIKTNLRLIYYNARTYTTKSYELLDVINEGVIGLIEAIDAYDETLGVAKFSTFATAVIRNCINNSLSANDNLVRRPKNFIKKVREYYIIKKECIETGKKFPSDDEFCEILNVTPERFSLIRSDYQYNINSLDEKIKEDEETELYAFVSSEETGFEKILNAMEDKRLMLSIKSLLSPFQYYLFYNRVFSVEPEKQAEIAKRFSITTKHVSRLERACIEIVKDAIKKHGSLSALELPSELEKNIEDTNIQPMDIDLVVQYLFFRDTLEEEERAIFKGLIKSFYLPNDNRFLKELGMNLNTYKFYYRSLMEKISMEDSMTKSLYGEFKSNILKQCGTKIFSMDLDMDLENIVTGAEYIAKIWNHFTYEEAMEIIKSNNILVTSRMEKLLVSYFDGGREKFTSNAVSKRKAEREVNAILFGFHRKNEVSINGLYDALTRNSHRFTLNQYDYLMTRKFHKDNLQERGITRVSDLGDLRELSRRLEKIHYGISRYKELNFTKSKYQSVRKKCLKILSSDKVTLLDMFYGVESPKYSIQQIADKWNVPYEEVRSQLQEAKNSALSIYLGRTRVKMIEEDFYIPYVLDETIDLSDDTRTILKEFLIEKKSYEEIATLHKKTQRKISVIVTSGLLKIDCYRFGIYKVSSKYTTNECKEIFNSLQWTSEEKSVIQMKLDGDSKEEIMKKTKLTFIRVSYILNKFYRLCDEHRVASVVISEDDIKREVTAHISEMVLNVKEKLLLAKLYGITCDVNPDGKKYTEEEFRLAHPDMSKQYKKFLKNALDTVRSKKAGLSRASLAYMPREDLNLSLKDPRIPISQKERELLYYSFELNGYPYKTLKELEEMYGELAVSLKSRIERTFVTIYKYENDEIPSTISYEYDVEPYLKYFSKSDQEILKDYYANKLTLDEIAKKNELTKGQVENLTFRLEAYLRDLIDEEISGYDFDYFWSVIDNSSIPFYGNKKKAEKIFYLYYEKRMSADEIISSLKLNCKRKVIMRTMSELMIAVSKYREGIKKVKTPTQSAIREYYSNHFSEMDLDHRQIYEKYIERMNMDRKRSTLSSFSQPNIPSAIILDLIEEEHDDIFSFERTSREEAIELLKKHKELSDSTRYTILRTYHISQRELMKGSDKMKILRFLSELDISQKVKSLRKSA